MTDLSYSASTEQVTENQLGGGFFENWPNPPSPATHLRILKASDHVVLAMRDGNVVGFATAISDGLLTAYIPLLEVLPEERGLGIGHELIARLLGQIGALHRIDLLCDQELTSFYQGLGFTVTTGAYIRNYSMQSGRLPQS